MTEAEAYQELKRLLSDKSWRMEHLYYITDKRGQKVKFKPNQQQKKFRASKHNRNINLKVRQIGFTTEACIDALDDCLFTENFHAGIIAHNLDDAEKIFTNKVKYAFDNLPEQIRVAREPRNDRSGELRFPNGSSISVSTSFRGGTLQKLHVSEFGKICAKFPDKAREIVTGAFNAVPLDGEINIESTAEGMNGYFYEMCERAQLQNNSELTPMDFKFHFFPWYEAEEYKLNPTGIRIPDALDAYFKRLSSEHGISLSLDQKAWYTKKYEEQGDDMHREYPSYPEEAFQASGRPVFNQQEIAADIKRAKALEFELVPFVIKDMEENEHIVKVKIFQRPAKDMPYAVAGDPAEGLETGDNSALSVLNKNFEQVASYAGKLDPDLFGALLVAVAKYYGNALVSWELNNHGHAVEMAIKLRKYYKLFRRKVKEKITNEITERVGWSSNMKTKMEMLDKLKEAYRDGSLEINCEETLREMLKCTIDEDGDIEINGKDRVACLGIALIALPQAVIDNSTQAIVPTKAAAGDITKMTIEQKLNHYKRKARE